MSLEHVVLEHLPADYDIHLAFFRHVRNASFLHQQLLARNAKFEYAFIDASVVSLINPFPAQIRTQRNFTEARGEVNRSDEYGIKHENEKAM